MTIQDDLKEHMLFDGIIRKYIQDCLKSGLDKKQIIYSFELYINEESKK